MTVAQRATKAARATALWKVLDHGTEIANSTAPTPTNKAVPNDSGANVCQPYPAKNRTPSKGRSASRRALTWFPGLSLVSLGSTAPLAGSHRPDTGEEEIQAELVVCLGVLAGA